MLREQWLHRDRVKTGSVEAAGAAPCVTPLLPLGPACLLPQFSEPRSLHPDLAALHADVLLAEQQRLAALAGQGPEPLRSPPAALLQGEPQAGSPQRLGSVRQQEQEPASTAQGGGAASRRRQQQQQRGVSGPAKAASDAAAGGEEEEVAPERNFSLSAGAMLRALGDRVGVRVSLALRHAGLELLTEQPGGLPPQVTLCRA